MRPAARILPHTLVQSADDLPSADQPFVVRIADISRALSKSHMHPGVELGAVLEGRAELYWCGSVVELRAGDCHFTNAMVPHFTGAPGGGRFRQVYAHITAEAVTALRPPRLGAQLLACFSPRVSQPVPVLRDRPDLADLLLRAATALEAVGELRWAEAWSLILQAIVAVAENQRSATGPGHATATSTQPDFLFAAMSHIQQHYRDPLSVAQIARHCCVSPSHLAHTFAQHLGCSPVNYRNTIRVQYAVEQILTTARSIESIADSCGFQSIANFNRLFKKRTGHSPSSFRRGPQE